MNKIFKKSVIPLLGGSLASLGEAKDVSPSELTAFLYTTLSGSLDRCATINFRCMVDL